jgi:hypothetical protein
MLSTPVVSDVKLEEYKSTWSPLGSELVSIGMLLGSEDCCSTLVITKAEEDKISKLSP